MSTFIVQTLVFVGSAVFFVPLFHRLKLGSVLGYLCAGILVGPYGLKLIHDPDNVVHLAELGVVFLLFLIGLEIQPARLWSMRRHLIGLGGTQILSCTVVFFLASYVGFGLSVSTSLIIGFALSLSSTAFAIQTLTERNQLNTEHGRSSFSILLMQDLVAILALALIPFLSTSQSFTSWTQTLSWSDLLLRVLVAGLGLWLISRFLMITSRWILRPIFRIIASTHMREIFTAATLFLVLGVAALMQMAGLSAALGTFIAGVLLSDSEYRHELEADLLPFKSLLMGLFFIAVGMSVNLKTVISQPILVMGLTIVYLIAKSILIYFTGRIYKLNHINSKNIALTIAQGGEFAFVIFSMAIQHNLANTELIQILTAVMTLSMALTPLLGMLDERLMMTRYNKQKTKQAYDEIKSETPQVIVAGFGRFGQIFGRILRAQGIPFVSIDHDPEHIELVRKFGNKVYYGDATRQDLLEAAGAAHAKYLVLAVDDPAMSITVAETVLKNFPNLKIFARARNRGHVFDLMQLGVTAIKRETFDSSVLFVGDLLIEMGYKPDRVSALIEKFRNQDELMLANQYKVRNDDKMFFSISKQGAAQLAQVLNDDLKEHI